MQNPKNSQRIFTQVVGLIVMFGEKVISHQTCKKWLKFDGI